MTTDLNPSLEALTPISLSEMDAAALMDRQDTKYLVNSNQLPALLDQLKDSYRVLTIDGVKQFEYDSSYYDYPDLDLFNEHVRGRSVRYKVRKREYVSSNLSFLELKNKTNKGRTIKKRIKTSAPHGTLNQTELDFLKKHNVNVDGLAESVRINFQRFTLVNLEIPERLTIDVQLKFNSNGNEAGLADLGIIELKQAKKSLRSPAGKAIRNAGIQELSLSKYCFSLILTNEELRYNRFKPRLLKLNNLTEHGNIWKSAI